MAPTLSSIPALTLLALSGMHPTGLSAFLPIVSDAPAEAEEPKPRIVAKPNRAQRRAAMKQRRRWLRYA